MAITKEKKSAILAKLKEIINQGKTMVFVNFHGLTVGGVNELRKSLREGGIGYYVAKKTLIKKAFGRASFTGDLPVLDGEVAIAYSTGVKEIDQILPAKKIYDFHQKNMEVVKIIGGIFEGKFTDASFMTQLAKIPSRETLYAQFVNLINSPIQGLAMALNEIAKQKSVPGGSA